MQRSLNVYLNILTFNLCFEFVDRFFFPLTIKFHLFFVWLTATAIDLMNQPFFFFVIRLFLWIIDFLSFETEKNWPAQQLLVM